MKLNSTNKENIHSVLKKKVNVQKSNKISNKNDKLKFQNIVEEKKTPLS